MQTAPTLRAAAAALAFAAAVACSRSDGARSRGEAEPPPAAEFLLTSGDSAYWVTTAGGRIRVRGAPLTLARYGGRFYEIYVGDDDRSFYDALFVGQRVFRRDLLTGDSAQVYGDATVAAASRRYASAHPGEEPLRENEEASENPRFALTAEVDLVESHGPYLTYEVHTTREVDGDVESAATRRGVLDLRTGRGVRVGDLVATRSLANAVIAEGRRRFVAAADSVRAARDERALRAQRALAQFVFEPSSFGITDVDRAPAVVFVAPGEGDAAGGYTLPLAPILLDPPPAWWDELRDALPASLRADSAARSDDAEWARGSSSVEARYDAASFDYTLRIRAARPGGGTGTWTVGRVQAPVRQLYWLDAPSLDSATRRALARAFDESALYSDDARTVSRDRGQSRRPNRPSLVGRRAPRPACCHVAPSYTVAHVARRASTRADRHPALDTRHPPSTRRRPISRHPR